MRRNRLTLMVPMLLWASLGGAAPAAAAPWQVTLPDSVVVEGGTALLRDLSQAPLPAAAGRMVVCAGASPNTVVAVSRQKILRQLVTAGLSSGVSFQGAEICRIVFAGRELDSEALAGEIRRELQTLMPASEAGAPAAWFEVQMPSLRLAVQGTWQVSLDRRTPLDPGRNLVQVRVEAGPYLETFSASVVLHQFGETARAVRSIDRETPLHAAQFSWEWQDLAELPQGVVAGRSALAGASCTRTLAAGDVLRESDLKETPLIMAGDPVDLMVVRGQVAVTVRASARQQGCLGQTIPVRNELTGRLVNARVAGPGLVEWRR